MKKLKAYFPLNKKVKKGDFISLLLAILIYVVIAAILGFVVHVIGALPIIKIVAGILSLLVWLYEVIGIILAILKFFGKK